MLLLLAAAVAEAAAVAVGVVVAAVSIAAAVVASAVLVLLCCHRLSFGCGFVWVLMLMPMTEAAVMVVGMPALFRGCAVNNAVLAGASSVSVPLLWFLACCCLHLAGAKRLNC